MRHLLLSLCAGYVATLRHHPGRMDTLAPAVARLERSLAAGKHSPSIATVRKYVKACGKKLILKVA